MFLWIIEHILGSFPVHYWPLAAAGSLGIVIVARLLRGFPFSNIIFSAAILIGLVSVFMWGGSGVNQMYQEQIEEAKAKIAAAEAETEELNTKLDKALKEKNRALQQAKEALHHRIDELAPQIDSVCKVDAVALQTLNELAVKGKK